jgi:hypothetical protein
MICMIMTNIVMNSELNKEIFILICWHFLAGTTKKHSTTEKRPFRTDLYEFKMDTLCQRYYGGKEIGIEKN